jgi:DNA-binding IclR family transcriptional regulator
MDADEREICTYLKTSPGQFIAPAEIARRAAGKKRFQQEPDWAARPLERLVERGLVDTDPTGRFCLKPRPKKGGTKRWLSPQVREILQARGKQFDEVLQEAELDEFYGSQ